MSCNFMFPIGNLAGFFTLALIAQVGLSVELSGQSITRTELQAKRRSTVGLPPPIRPRSAGAAKRTGVRQAAYEESFASPLHRFPGSSESQNRNEFHGSSGQRISGHHPHHHADGEVTESAWLLPDARWGDHADGPRHAHQILRAPGIGPTSKISGKTGSTGHAMGGWVHPPFSSHRRRIQPAPPVLPGARERQTWKAPYSYGYFGASGTRHWSLHHGYRDRYTEWRFK